MAKQQHTHVRKPERVKAWQHKTGAALPKWARTAGIKPDHLGRKVGGKMVRAVPLKHWLVLNESGDTVVVLSPEQFAAEYEATDK